MAETALRPALLDAARNLARANAASEPEIKRIYLFPDSRQIRLNRPARFKTFMSETLRSRSQTRSFVL